MANKKKKILEEALKMHEAAGGTYSSPEAAAKQQYANTRHETAKNAYNQMFMEKAAERKRKKERERTELGNVQTMRTSGAERVSLAEARAAGAKKAFEDYMGSDERKQRTAEQQKKQEQNRFIQHLLTGTSDIMQPEIIQDDKETQLRKASEDAKQEAAQAKRLAPMADYLARFPIDPEERSQEERTTVEALREFDQMPYADRAALESYAVNGYRDQNLPIELAGIIPTAQQEAAGLIARYGKGKVDAMAAAYMRWQNAQLNEQVAQKSREAVDSGAGGSIGHNIASVAANVGGGIVGTLGQLQNRAMEAGIYGTVDPNAVGSAVNTYVDSVRDETFQNITGDQYNENGEKVEDGGALRQGAGYLYQAAMSAADSVARMWAAGAFGGGTGLASGLAATQAFSRSMAAASANGATPAQAALSAAADATWEYLSEKLPLDKLIDMAPQKNFRAILGNALKQAGIEIVGEEANLVASLFSQAFILKEKSDFNLQKQQYMAQGMSEEEATRAATANLWEEAKQTAIVAGMSGGFQGATQTLTGAFGQPDEIQNVQQDGNPAEESPVIEPQEESPLSVQQDPVGQDTESAPVMPEEAAGAPETRELDVVTQAVQQAQQNREAAQNAQQEPALAQQLTPEQRVQEAVKGVHGKGNTPYDFAEKEAEPTTAGELPKNGSLATPISSASKNNIFQSGTEVKGNPVAASDYDAGIKGTGAAEQNFTGKAAYADLLQEGNVQRDRPGDVRPVEVPKTDGAGRRVTELAGNAYGAKATPDYMANEIESLIQDGKLGFDTRSNQESLRRAADALEGNTEGVKAQITENLANDKVQDGDIEKAMLLYVKNANSKDKADQEAAAQILVQLGKMANITGRNLQILGMLRRMTPEGQLLYIEKSARSMVDSLNQKRSAREKAVPRRKEQAERAVEAVNRAKEQTAQAVKTAAKRVRYQKGKVVIEGNQHGEPFVFEYAQKVGEALAQGIERRATKGPKGKTFLQEIAENLQRFANEKVDTPKQQKRTLTATELLRDYIQNQDFYIAAWENAQQNLRDSGNKNQKLDEFMNTGIGVDANNSAKNKIFAKALTEAAIASGETKRMIETQKALGFRNMADPVAEKLISQTGATGDMAETIRAAARDYISQVEAGIEQDPKSRSESSIVEGKIRAALQDVEKTLDKLARSDGKTKVDTGKQVVELLTKKYGFDQADASHVADVVKAEYQRMVREKSQKILAQSFKERKPREQKTSDQIFDELANLGAFDADSEFNQAAAEKWLKTKDTYIEPELAKAYLDAKTDDEKEAALDNIYKDVASRIPAALGEKWDAWRNVAMLLNPKTHIRNMGATGSFLPFVEVKRVIGAGLEKALLDEEQRTKAVLGSDKRSKALLKWAKEDAKKPKVIERLGQSGTTGDNARSKIQEHRQILPGILDKVRKGNMAVMEAEDRFFKRITYARSLASFLKARGYSETDIQGGLVPAGVLEEGRTLAIQEAQKATFNDRNAFSDTIAKLGRGADKIPVIGKVISKGALPFLRTPANVVARAWDYSPMKLAETFYQVRKGDIDAATVIDQVSSSLTGTAAMALGAALAAGIAPDVELVGRIEDEDEKESGATEYSLRVGDKYYSVSWLSPTMIPLFIGANLYDKFQALGEENGMDGWGVAQAFMEVGADALDPMLELSMLSSLNDMLDAAADEDDAGGKAIALFLNAATSYFTQGLPTIFGQAEQATETEKSSTYVNTDNKVEKVIKKALGNASRRIPGIDLFQMPRLDEFGQVVKNEGDGLERAFNAFLNPFNVSQKKTDPISQELSRLRKAGAENASIPLPQRTISYTDTDGEKHTDVRLSQEQFQKLAEKQGQTEQAVLSALLDSDDFRAMSDEVKDDVLAIVHSYAKETGELAAVENHLGYSATWMEELAEADDPAKYIVQRVAGANLNRAMTDLDTAWDHSWNTTAKERALDEAYAEYKSMSKEAQKEIETFAAGTAKKYLEARRNGISHKDFLAAAKNVETVKGTGKYNSETKKNTVKDIDKREAIAKTTGLTEHQVDIIMKAYMPDYDPTDEKPNKTEFKYDYIRQELGMTPAEYADTYRAYLENAKRHEKIAAIQDLGYDYTTASKLYRLYNGKIDVVAWAGK